MKLDRLKTKLWAKLLAAILLFIFGVGFLAGVAGVYVCDSYGVYDGPQDELQKDMDDQMLTKYSVQALATYTGNCSWKLSPNYRYAIYEGGMDCPKVAGNLDLEDITEDAVIHEFSVTEETGYQLADSMFGAAYVQGAYDDHYRIEEQIQQFYYCITPNDRQMDANEDTSGTTTGSEAAADQANATETENLTDTFELYVTGTDTSSSIMYQVKPDLYRVDTQKGIVWITKNVRGQLGVPLSKMKEISMEASELAISPYTVWEFMFDDYYGGQIDQGWFRAGAEVEGTDYTVVGLVAEDLVFTGKWETADFFEQSRILLGWLYNIKYVSFAVILICFLLGLAMFVFLMSAAGHQEIVYGTPIGRGENANGEPAIRGADVYGVPAGQAGAATYGSVAETVKGKEDNKGSEDDKAVVSDTVRATAPGSEIRLRIIDRFPMDLAFFITSILCASCAVPVIDILDGNIKTVQAVCVLIVCLAIAYVVALEFCMSFAVNVKVGGWWERTVICRAFRLIVRFFRWLIRNLRASTSGLTMGTRIWALFALFVAFELIGLVVMRFSYAPLMFCWLAEKVIFFFALMKILKEFGEIKQAGAEIAGGNLDYKVETESMFTDIADVGNSLNTIGDGLAGAVDERMKSERMKTELITNVSHDIKTPLTSIINYTDLLTKLDLQDPTAREYLEVLGRQSARLKKLIEDLIEASKASSGVLKLEMENVNASMLLMQAVGEYEEKFSRKGLDLRVTGEESEMKVRADSRYLWRVFDNLMNNMLKYAQPGTRAYIDLESGSDDVSIIFRNVSEMPLHISGDELMERFVRGDSSRSTEGSGLGLSIADSLVTLMGGKMQIVVDGDLFKVIVRMAAEKEDKP